MFKNIYHEKPNIYKKNNAEKLISLDWQVYLQCEKCLNEERYDLIYGIPTEEILQTPCSKCSYERKKLVRHLFEIEYFCNECKHLKKELTVDINSVKCENCFSKSISFLKLGITPPFPPTFSDRSEIKENDWGISGYEDSQFMIRSLMHINYLPDFGLHFLPYIRICERLKVTAKYPDSHHLGALLNIEGNLLRDYFRHTSHTEAGLHAIDVFEDAKQIYHDAPESKALVEHNIAMSCYSLLVKINHAILKVKTKGIDLRDKGIAYSQKALTFFENESGYELHCARIHTLIGNILSTGFMSEKDIDRSLFHFNKADNYNVLEERQAYGLYFSKAVVISKKKNPSPQEIAEGIQLLNKYVEWDEWGRVNTDKGRVYDLLNELYWKSGEYLNAMSSAEKAYAIAIAELGKVLDMTSLHFVISENSNSFSALFRSYVHANKPFHAIKYFEQFRSKFIESQINIYEKTNPINDEADAMLGLLTGMLFNKPSSPKEVTVDDNFVLMPLNKICSHLDKHEHAFLFGDFYDGVFSIVLLIPDNDEEHFCISFQNSLIEDTIRDGIANLNEIIYGSSFREDYLKELADFYEQFLPASILLELKNRNINKLGLALPTIFHYLPFEAMISEQAKNLDCQLNNYYLPSLRILSQTLNKEPKQPTKNILLIPYNGLDLPKTKIELNNISSVAKEKCVIFDNTTQGKKELLCLLEMDFDYIHFICHGNLDLINPLNSSLILDINDNGISGSITASEISELKFSKTPIVSLSACNSLLTAMDGHSSYNGLAGSFLKAGAKAVIATKWAVYDNTGEEFMTRFYANIFNAQLDAYDSFIKVQSELKNKWKIEDWSAFAYLGLP